MTWNEDVVFVKAVTTVLAHEGGYINDPGDPGGETKFGISKHSYPALVIASLTREDAAQLYYRDWWIHYRYDALPPDIAVKLLDIAVPAPVAAHRALQRALRACGKLVSDDGVIGTATLACVEEVAVQGDLRALLAALKSEFAGYCRLVSVKRAIEGRESFENGWLARAYS